MSYSDEIAVLRAGSGPPELWIVAGVHGDEVENLDLGMQAVRAAAAWLGMLSAPAVAPARTARRHTLRPEAGGRVRQLRRLGEAIEEGDAVCRLRGRDGTVVETLTSPVAGWVAVHVSYGEIAAGEEAAVVFEEALRPAGAAHVPRQAPRRSRIVGGALG